MDLENRLKIFLSAFDDIQNPQKASKTFLLILELLNAEMVQHKHYDVSLLYKAGSLMNEEHTHNILL